MIAAPLFVLWFGGLALLFLDGRRRAVGWTALATLVAAGGLLVPLARRVASGGALETTTGGWPAGIGITLRADALGLTFACVSLAVLAAALAWQLAAGRPTRRFPALVLFMGTGLTGLFLTGDAFNFYVFFEVAMTTAFAMTTDTRTAREVRAALLFVTLNVFGSAVFLLAIAGLYHVSGTLELRGIAAALAAADAPRATGIGALLVAAFGLKLGLFPFHTWLPEVYRDLRPEVAAVFSGALANIGSYGMLRFGAGVMPAEVAAASPLLIALGAASILYGSALAIGSRSARDVLAYSSVGQAGYVLIATALATPTAWAAGLVYAVIVPLTKSLLFLSAGVRGTVARAAFAVGAFSLAGLPPFAGFTAKLAIFRGGIDAGAWLALAALVTGSALTFVYIFPAYQRMTWAASDDGAHAPRQAAAVLLALSVALAIIGAWPAPLLRLGDAASLALTLEAGR